MTRTIPRTFWRRTFRALPVACLLVLGVSCADGVVAPEIEPASRTSPASAGKTANPEASLNVRANGGEAADGNAASACGGAPEAASGGTWTSASPDATAEPLPDDLCSIAEFRTGASQNGSRIVAAFIDASGGSLRIDDFEIVVPPGAVATRTRFSIKLPPANSGSPAKHALAEFLPHNVTFAMPVTIRLPLVTTNADPDAPVAWWSASGKQWIDQPTASTSDGRIEAQVDHFSYYGTRLRRGITIAGG